MRRGTALVLLCAFLWGTTFPANRFGLESAGLSPYSFLYFRFVLATLLLLGFAAWKRRIQLALFRDRTILMLGVLNALGYGLQYVAQNSTTASKTALLVNVNVLITALLAYHLLKERIAPATGVGAVIGVVGVFLLTSNGNIASLRFSNTEFVGDLLAFGTGICWTVYILTMKRYLTRHPDADVIGLVTVLFVVTVIVLFPIALFTDGVAYKGDWRGLVTISYLAIGPTVFAFWAYQEGLKTTSAAVSSILLLFETVVAVGFSFALLGENLTGWAALGAVLILVATYLASRAPAGQDPGQVAPEAAAPAEQAAANRGLAEDNRN